MVYLMGQLGWLLAIAFVAGVVIGWIAQGRSAEETSGAGESS